MRTTASPRSWTACTGSVPGASLRSWTLLMVQEASPAPFVDTKPRLQSSRCQPCLMMLTSCPIWQCGTNPGALITTGRWSWLQRVCPPPARLTTPPTAWSSLLWKCRGTHSTPRAAMPALTFMLSRAWTQCRWAPMDRLIRTPCPSSVIMSHVSWSGCWVSYILAHCLWESTCWWSREWLLALYVLAWCHQAWQFAWSMDSASVCARACVTAPLGASRMLPKNWWSWDMTKLAQINRYLVCYVDRFCRGPKVR